MSKRKTYHITPASNNSWNVKKENSERASFNFDNKADAINKGRELAKKAPLGQIKIHRGDGVIQKEHTYGKDPEKYKS